MPTPPLSDEKMLEALWALTEYGSVAEAARRLELNDTTLRSRLDRAREKFPDGERLKDELESRVADGFKLDGYSQFTKTLAGDNIWLKAKRAEMDYWAGIAEVIDSREPKQINIPKPKVCPMDGADVIPWLNIGDAHIGMLAHEDEVGANFDLKIAQAEIRQAAFDLIDMAPNCERMVINDLGDGTHYENFKAMTERSGHQMDFDTRFPKMIDTYLDVMESVIEKALTKAETIDVIINQGNHSETNDYWAARYFRRLYERLGTNRVNVIKNESPFIAYRMGNTFVLIHHGHKVKPEALRQIMSVDYRIDWGEAKFCYIDGGHIHHFSAKELGGAIWESFNNLAAMDKHTHDGAWRSQQAMTLVLRSRTYGELGRYKMPIEKVWDRIIAKDPNHYVPPIKRAFAV